MLFQSSQWGGGTYKKFNIGVIYLIWNTRQIDLNAKGMTTFSARPCWRLFALVRLLSFPWNPVSNSLKNHLAGKKLGPVKSKPIPTSPRLKICSDVPKKKKLDLISEEDYGAAPLMTWQRNTRHFVSARFLLATEKDREGVRWDTAEKPTAKRWGNTQSRDLGGLKLQVECKRVDCYWVTRWDKQMMALSFRRQKHENKR